MAVQPGSPNPNAKRVVLEYKLCFVSLLDRRQVEGVELIRSLLEAQKYLADHFEYKIVQKTEVTRPINPKNPKGPTQKVTIEEKLNVNGSLRAMRQLAWRVGKDPENLLLVQLRRSKGETCALPLLFKEIFDRESTVFVTGSNKKLHHTLTAKVDLEFARIPPEVAAHPPLLDELVKRAERVRSLQSTAREIMELHGLKAEVAQKLRDIAAGKKVSLSNEEAVNILLLADLVSRYNELLTNFQGEVFGQKHPPQALAKMFEELTQGVQPSYLAKRMKEFLPEEVQPKSNGEVFAHLYKKIQEMADGKKADPKLNRDALMSRVKAIVLLARSQFDAGLWKKCIFFHDPTDEETTQEEREAAILELVKRVSNRVLQEASTAGAGLDDLHLVHNLHSLVAKWPLWVEEGAGQLLQHLTSSVVAPVWGLRLLPQKVENKCLSIFSDKEKKPEQLSHGLQLLTQAWTRFTLHRLEDALSDFLAPGKDGLFTRFQENFFEILYYKVVQSTGLPLNRAKLAQWLEGKNLLVRLASRGYRTGPEDKDPFPQLELKHLLNPDENLLHGKNYTMQQFQAEFEKSLQELQGLMARITRMAQADPSPTNPANQFLALAQQGDYRFAHESLRQALRSTGLYEELHEVVTNSIQAKIEAVFAKAINKKALLRVPGSLGNLLYIGKEFDLSLQKRRIRVHLLELPVATPEELPDPVDVEFSRNLLAHLKNPTTTERKALVQAMNIVSEYRRIMANFQPLLEWVMVDQLLTAQKKLDKVTKTMGPEHVKFYISDDQKLMVGTLKDMDLNKFCNFQNLKVKSGGNQPPCDVVSAGQLHQWVLSYQSCKEGLQVLQEVFGKVRSLLDRFAEGLKRSKEYVEYLDLIGQLEQILMEPLDSMGPSTLRKVRYICQDIKRLADASPQPDGVVYQLVASWKANLPPAQENRIHFYAEFLDEGRKFTNMLVDFNSALELMGHLNSKRCLVLFPEPSKRTQLEHLMAGAQFIRKRFPNVMIFLETSGLSEDQVKEFVRTIPPNCLFQSLRLEPLARGN